MIWRLAAGGADAGAASSTGHLLTGVPILLHLMQAGSVRRPPSSTRCHATFWL